MQGRDFITDSNLMDLWASAHLWSGAAAMFQCLHVAHDTGDEGRKEEEILRSAHLALGTSVEAVECCWQLEHVY